MNKILHIIIVCVSAIMISSRVSAEIIQEASKAQIAEIFKSEGYSYSVDSDGDIIWKIDGRKTLLVIAEDGKSIQFSASFRSNNTTLEKVNKWNATKRFSRSYLDKDGDPRLELDLEFDGGVTTARIADFLQTCRSSLGRWIIEVVQ